MRTVASNTAHPRRRRTGGFTLIELLVVVAVLIVLLAIMIPVLGLVRTGVRQSSSQATLRTIGMGLDMYHNEHNTYPDSYWAACPYGSDGGWYGSQILVQALAGYRDEDGKDGLGFRKIHRGQVYGPYVDFDAMKMISWAPPGTGDARLVFVDAFDQPILYYKLTPADEWFDPQEDTQPHNTTADPNSVEGVPVPFNQAAGRSVNVYASRNGRAIEAGQNEPYDFYRMDYLLLSPGADGKWTPLWDTDEKSDDITNLQ